MNSVSNKEKKPWELLLVSRALRNIGQGPEVLCYVAVVVCIGKSALSSHALTQVISKTKHVC